VKKTFANGTAKIQIKVFEFSLHPLLF